MPFFLYLNIICFLKKNILGSFLSKLIGCHGFRVCLYLLPYVHEMSVLVDSKCRNIIIPTASTYTSSGHVFHDTTNNGIDNGLIITQKNGRLINHATWRQLSSLLSSSGLGNVFLKIILHIAIMYNGLITNTDTSVFYSVSLLLTKAREYCDDRGTELKHHTIFWLPLPSMLYITQLHQHCIHSGQNAGHNENIRFQSFKEDIEILSLPVKQTCNWNNFHIVST